MSSAPATQLAKLSVSKGRPGVDLRTLLVLGAALLAATSEWHWWNVPRDTRTSEAIVAEYLLISGVSVLILTLLYRLHTSFAISRVPGALVDIPIAISMFGKCPSNKVFFGPRMEFSYAALRREPPRGLPVWWGPGTSFAAGDVVTVNRALENDDFDMLVFLKDDRTRMPLAVLQHKLASYDRVSGFSELDVYVRRKGL